MTGEPIPDCPYRGLEPFSENERRYFFGRETEIRTIGANLVTSQLTILYGMSGVGKTSVLLAGVVPFVREQPDVTAIVFRSWQLVDFERQFKRDLSDAVHARCGATLNLESPLDDCIAEAADVTRGTIVVIFDQFEEYLRYHSADSPQGRAFDTAFARAVNRAHIDANFLLAIREDALAQLDRFRQFIPDLLANRLRLEPLDADGARRAIRMPLVRYNEVVRAHGRDELAMEVEDNLVNALVDQVQIGGTAPFLQLVLLKLWDEERKRGSNRLRVETLRSMGSADGIVRAHVETVMQRLTARERSVAAGVFDRLVTASGEKFAMTGGDLAKKVREQEAVVSQLLGKLAEGDARILRAVRGTGASEESSYEIVHDVLSRPIQDWCAGYIREQELAARIRRIALIVAPGVLVLLVIGVIVWRDKVERDEIVLRNKLERDNIVNRYELQMAQLRAEEWQKQAVQIKLTLQQLKGDTQAVSRSSAELARITSKIEERECRALAEHRRGEQNSPLPEDYVAPEPDDSPVDHCGLETFDGTWSGGRNYWTFHIDCERNKAVLTMQREDGKGSGRLIRNGAVFVGTVTEHGKATRYELPFPDRRYGCNSVGGFSRSQY